MPHPMASLIPVLAELDELLGRLVPAGDITLRGVENDELVAWAPGPERALENLWLARRSLVSIHLLAQSTVRSAADHTEDIAVLGRRLLELLVQTIWLTDYAIPSGLTLPSAPGSLDPLLSDGDPESWPDRLTRTGFAAAVCAATEWVDIQALRAQLAELNEQKKTGREIARSYSGASRSEAERRLGMLCDQQRMIGLRLTDLGAPLTPRPDTTGILMRHAPHLVVLWRTESDVTHGGAVGRHLQRGGESGPDLGASAPPWRQVLVLIMTAEAIVGIASRALRILDIDAQDLRDFIPGLHAAFEEAQQHSSPAQ